MLHYSLNNWFLYYAFQQCLFRCHTGCTLSQGGKRVFYIFVAKLNKSWSSEFARPCIFFSSPDHNHAVSTFWVAECSRADSTVCRIIFLSLFWASPGLCLFNYPTTWTAALSWGNGPHFWLCCPSLLLPRFLLLGAPLKWSLLLLLVTASDGIVLLDQLPTPLFVVALSFAVHIKFVHF